MKFAECRRKGGVIGNGWVAPPDGNVCEVVQLCRPTVYVHQVRCRMGRLVGALLGLVGLALVMVACAQGQESSPPPTLVSSPLATVPVGPPGTATPVAANATHSPPSAPATNTVVHLPTLATLPPTDQPAPSRTAPPPSVATAAGTPAAATATVAPSPTRATMRVVVYYTRIEDNEIAFVPVERTVPRSSDVGRAAIEELLKGPTSEERAQGIYSPIPEKAGLLSVRVSDGVAYADFSKALEAQVGGSEWVMAIRKAITLTLLHLPTVDRVAISIEGQSEGILQP